VTVRDEARLLPAHLEYHRLLGVERAYVYLDEPGDATQRSIAHLDWVSTSRCVAAERFRGVPGLERFVACWKTHLAARQALNVADAMGRAEAAGCEWLLAIDADELVCLNRTRAEPGALPRALARLPERVATGWLRNLEVVQCQRSAGLVFREARRFKRRRGPGQPIRDPRSGRIVCRAWFFGHDAGKSAVRLGGAAVPAGSHGFLSPDGDALPTASIGELLHYYAYDYRDWIRRNRNYRGHTPHHLSGLAVEAQKLLWIELVETLDAAALEDYFVQTLVLAPDEIARLEKWRWQRPFQLPCIVEVDSVAEAFRSQPSLQRY
jgi:hypothetical protein